MKKGGEVERGSLESPVLGCSFLVSNCVSQHDLSGMVKEPETEVGNTE